MPKRYRHAYLHTTEAADPSHVVAAALELRAHKTENSRYRAGHLFVDGPEALESSRTILQEQIAGLERRRGATTSAAKQKRFDTQLTNLRHAHASIRSTASRDASLPYIGSRDKLYVKGHGNAHDPDHITTKVAEKSGDEVRGYMARHDIGDVAAGIDRLQTRFPALKLDNVRLTSCGSGGGYGLDGDLDHGTITERGDGAASSLAGALRARMGERAPDVYGYRASSNTSLPSPSTGHFHSNLKFPALPTTTDKGKLYHRVVTDTRLSTPDVDVGRAKTVTQLPQPADAAHASFTDAGRRRVETASAHLPPVSGTARLASMTVTTHPEGLTARVRRSQTRRKV